MGIQLTAFEVLTVDENDPLKQQYRQEQAEIAKIPCIDFSLHGPLGMIGVWGVVNVIQPEKLEKPEIHAA